MKKWISLYNIIILMGVFLCGGCTTYLIDSNPQGLRVSVDNIECGRTLCEYTWTHGGEYGSKIIRVYPPTRQQLKDYEQKNNKIVSVWTNEEIAKTCPVLQISDKDEFLQYIKDAKEPVGIYLSNIIKMKESQGDDVPWLKDYLKVLREEMDLPIYFLEKETEGWQLKCKAEVSISS